MELIGAGFGRTGTQSLQAALERLGLGPCYHMDELNRHPTHRPHWELALRGEPVDWNRFLSGYRSGVDWPVCRFWPQLREAFPEARIVLTMRDPDAWYESMARTVRPLTTEGLKRASGEPLRQLRFGNELIFERTFGGEFDDRAATIARYRAHIDHVRASVEPSSLLCLDSGDGWEPLCEFLGLPVPDEPYPHLNRTSSFKDRLSRPGPDDQSGPSRG